MRIKKEQSKCKIKHFSLNNNNSFKKRIKIIANCKIALFPQILLFEYKKTINMS
jgi:hypothetical protein